MNTKAYKYIGVIYTLDSTKFKVRYLRKCKKNWVTNKKEKFYQVNGKSFEKNLKFYLDLKSIKALTFVK